MKRRRGIAAAAVAVAGYLGVCAIMTARKGVPVLTGQSVPSIAAALPAEDRFSRSEALVDALLGAGFLDPHIDERTYAVTVGPSEFLESRQVSGTARFLRASLDDATWTRFLEEATAEITRELGDQVEVELAVSFVTACTPC